MKRHGATLAVVTALAALPLTACGGSGSCPGLAHAKAAYYAYLIDWQYERELNGLSTTPTLAVKNATWAKELRNYNCPASEPLPPPS